jgi:phosphopantothenoylcysteine decarboxylase/phosphopantothenate--cysteine ligase
VNVLLGICGSIAAYKALELIRLLKKEGCDVKVILTKSALNFTTPLSCQTLSDNEVYIDQFILTRGIKHLTLSDWADLIVVGPATANIIAKAAHGIGDDLLSTTLLSFPKAKLFVPAMDAGMWSNSIVRENVVKLKAAGCMFLEPVSGALASGKIGKGRFPSGVSIVKKIMSVYEKRQSLSGMKILVSGGRTEENIDSVRVITNRSSGKMALELMFAAASRGAKVRGVIGETSVTIPVELDVKKVRTSSEMLQQLQKEMTWCDCLIMAAAVGDYAPAGEKTGKIHDSSLTLKLKKNTDIVKTLSRKKKQVYIVGFSLEDNDALKRAKLKLKSKKLDACVLNSSDALGKDKTQAKLLSSDGKVVPWGIVTKWQLANKILDTCIKGLKKRSRKR